MVRPTGDWLDKGLKWGPGWAIALYLVYWLTTAADAQGAEHTRQIQALTQTLDRHVQDMRVQSYLLRLICVNTASTDGEKAACGNTEVR